MTTTSRAVGVWRGCAAGIAALLASAACAQDNWTPHVREAVDLIIAQQAPAGCIPDVPAGLRTHQDGAMARTLLAAAYGHRATLNMRHRNAFRDGLRWLAACMERNEQGWAGTWRAAYAAKPPHVALPTPPDAAAQDARALSSTSGLFVYLVALYTYLTGDETVAIACRPHVLAALEFLLDKNRGQNDLFYRGWHQAKGSDTWELCRKQYAMDQADVALGLWAGVWLIGQPRYRLAADRLERRFLQHFYDRTTQAFGTMLDEKGKLTPPGEDPDSYALQGYVAWVFGPSRETTRAMRWLEDRLAPDGTFRKRRTDKAYVLPAAAFCLGASRVGSYFSDLRKTRRWLRDVAITPKGGVRELAEADSPTRNDLAGWVIMAWLGAEPCPFIQQGAKPPGLPFPR